MEIEGLSISHFGLNTEAFLADHVMNGAIVYFSYISKTPGIGHEAVRSYSCPLYSFLDLEF